MSDGQRVAIARQSRHGLLQDSCPLFSLLQPIVIDRQARSIDQSRVRDLAVANFAQIHGLQGLVLRRRKLQRRRRLRRLHLQVVRLLDDLLAPSMLISVMVADAFELIAPAVILFVIFVIRGHAHPAHDPVEPQGLVRVRVVVRAEERLADHLVHLGLVVVLVRRAFNFLRGPEPLLARAGNAGFEVVLRVAVVLHLVEDTAGRAGS